MRTPTNGHCGEAGGEAREGREHQHGRPSVCPALPSFTPHLEEEDEQDAEKESGRPPELVLARKEEERLARPDEGGDAGEEEDLEAG